MQCTSVQIVPGPPEYCCEHWWASRPQRVHYVAGNWIDSYMVESPHGHAKSNPRVTETSDDMRRLAARPRKAEKNPASLQSTSIWWSPHGTRAMSLATRSIRRWSSKEWRSVYIDCNITSDSKALVTVSFANRLIYSDCVVYSNAAGWNQLWWETLDKDQECIGKQVVWLNLIVGGFTPVSLNWDVNS